MSGEQEGFLKNNKQVCESWNSFLMVGDQILMSCNKMQINYLKIVQCDFLDFRFRFRLSQLNCTYDKKLQTSKCFVSGKTCKIGSA